MNQLLGWEDLKAEIVELHVNLFPEAELREISAFYRTPVGKKLVESKDPLIKQKTDLIQQKLPELMPRMEKLSQQMERELKDVRESGR